MMYAIKPANRYFNLLLFAISFTFLLVWLPLVRIPLEPGSYSWGSTYFGWNFRASRLNASYWFLLVQVVFYFALMWSFYRISKRNIFKILVGIWIVHFFGNFLYICLSNPSFAFRGDTLGVEIRFVYILIPLILLVVFLVAKVFRAENKLPQVAIPWNRRNTNMAFFIFGPLPIQVFLLAMGDHLSAMDQAGVVITIAQCLLMPLVVLPYGKPG